MNARREQPWLIRLTHWVNLPLMVVGAGSGLQILAAYPFMGPRGALYGWYPFQEMKPPSWLRLGGWLAGARALHFGLGWFLILTGLIYLAYLAFSGEWRRRMFFPLRDGKNALHTALYYLRMRPAPAHAGLYNGLQRLAYTAAIALAVVLVLSGLAMYKPTQLAALAWFFGGYDGARAIHFLCWMGLAGFLPGHILMVLLHPRSFLAMFTGGAKDGDSQPS